MDNSNISKTPVSDGAPYFMGDEALIKFSSGEEGYGSDTYWLVKKSDHTVRPFESHMALDAAFEEDLEEALKNVVVISPPNIDSENDITDGSLEGYSILGPEYAIKDDGTAKPLHFSNHQWKGRFGKQVDEESENHAADAVERFLSILKGNQEKTGIPPEYIDELKSDEKLMAFYISCMAYGKYKLQDVYTDIMHTYNQSKE